MVIRVLHACGHRTEHILDCKPDGPAMAVYVAMLRAMPCPKCLDANDPVEMGRLMVDQTRRQMFAKPDDQAEAEVVKRGYPAYGKRAKRA